jgi:hypothetical protein
MVSKIGNRVFFNGVPIKDYSTDIEAFSGMLKMTRKGTTIMLATDCCNKGFDRDDDDNFVCKECGRESKTINAFEVDLNTQIN